MPADSVSVRAAATLATAFFFPALAASVAEARLEYAIKQITHITEGRIFEPAIRQMDGNFVTFVSDGDVLGPGTGHVGRREVYLWSRADDEIVRITDSGSGESYSASRVTDDYVSKRSPAIVFVSTGDLDPSTGNADGNPEVFVWRMDTGAIRQITNTTAPVVNAEPHFSDTGDCIMFQSTGDLDDNDGSYALSAPTGFENSDGSPEIFYLDFDDLEFDAYHVTQVSDGPPGTTSSNPTAGGYFFAYQCTNQTYQSDHDQLGEGISGIHVYEHRKQTALRTRVSVGGIDGLDSIEPRMSGTGLVTGGPSVVFASEADLKGIGSTGFHIYKDSVARGLTIQLTFDEGGGHRRPSISDGSRVVAFESTGEVVDPARPSRRGPDAPHNEDGNSEIIRIVGRRKVDVVTRTSGCTNDQASLAGTGRAIAFRSDCDLVAGSNLGGIEQAFAYYEIKGRDPFYRGAGCDISDDCCSTGNGCYEQIRGTALRGARR